MRLVLSIIALLMLAANPCFAKDSHAQHGARSSATGNAASGKGGGGVKPAPSNANVPSEEGAIIAPPVLPAHRVPQQQVRIVGPSAKMIGPGQASRGQATATTISTPIAANAIGQPLAAAKNFAVPPPSVSALQRPGAASPPINRTSPAVSPVSPAAAHVNVANATNRGSINGATVVRPAAGPALVGGPAQVHYGINGTTVHNKH